MIENINWYPGHMKKTKELIQTNLKLVDVVIEILDARVPFSSKNPEIDKMIHNKPKIIALNKSDLADEIIVEKWYQYFKKNGMHGVKINALNGNGINQLLAAIKKETEQKVKQAKLKNMRERPIRAMIVGIPNVGKSSLINRMIGRKGAQIGNKPGVTKGKQWLKLKGNIELLDTPGILWPKFEDKQVGITLAFLGSIKDEILDIEELALELMKYLSAEYPENVIRRYNLEKLENEPLANIDTIAYKRGCILSGDRVDYERVSKMILDEFRSGKIGKISLEKPE